ncbi:MAG: acyl carrier protein [Deltaproteobacteria bacterium]|nr:acyl carrier protein [Deltaproteobacteria bacterium]MBK7070470.1 acyl carrier protein [Deltaproteobacteria bacterium]MBK8691648.1 acyl carrier protein [Deltaproteobacteria bacterium]MBP6829302.1 acyl carrier protein [Deltaproteobacteria bacterium]TAK29286.1 MAG: acyl carrier protein [Myxococcaceae bacterium]
MTGSDVSERVRALIANNLDVPLEQVRPEASFINDLQADSLAIVELVLALEEEFGVEIPDEATDKIRAVQDAIDYIVARVPAKS